MSCSVSVMAVAPGRGTFSQLVAGVLSAAALSLAALLLPQASHAQGRELPDFADLVERVGPAVVNIRTTERVPEGLRLPSRQRSPALQGSDEVPRGEGSGFIISADGYVVTNAHVIEGAAEVYVSLTDKREFKAKIVGTDERSDVAVVKIEASGLPALRIGDSNRLRVGEWVVAIGSPFGLENSVTAGIVSAKQRETGSDTPFIQTDVAVNSGSSGGPLINMRGEAVGITSRFLSPAAVRSFVGVSLAIPIDEAMRIVDQLKATGRVVRGFLGISLVDVPRELAEEYGLNKGKAKGAFVSQVVPGTPAEKAGIQPGDVVLSVNGKAVDGGVDLRRTLGALKPGSSVNLQINRRGKMMEFKPNLAEMNPQVMVNNDRSPDTEGRMSTSGKVWGLTVTNLSEAERQAARGVSGVRVTAVAAGAEAVGLRAGDVILAVGAADVADVKQFDAVVSKLDKGRPLSVTVLRGEWAQFLRIPASK